MRIERILALSRRYGPIHPTGLGIIVLAGVAASWISSCQFPAGQAGKAGAGDSFVIMMTGNWHGQLGPCGCAERQLGGIDRRTHLINAASEAQRLLLDAGPLIETFGRQDEMKFETFLAAMKQLRYDAVGLTVRELSLLKTLGVDPGMRPPVVVSNLPETRAGQLGLVTFVEKKLQMGNHSLDCLVLALTAPPSSQADGPEWAGDLITDPVAAVKAAMNRAGINPAGPSDKMVVVMVSADQPEWIQKLRQIPAIKVIAAKGYSDEPEFRPAASGQAVEVTTSRLGKYIAWLEVPAGGDHQAADFRFKRVAVDADFPRDPAIVSLINEYQTKLRIENLAADEEKLPRLPLENQNRFMGSDSCRPCHTEIYEKWKTFKHGHAFETLQRPDVNRQYDPECVACHTVGMMYQTGFRSIETTPELADVGCESCHGPGKNHIENPTATYQHPFTACEDCHNHETSPKFDQNRDEYFKKIQHWPEPRKYWP